MELEFTADNAFPLNAVLSMANGEPFSPVESSPLEFWKEIAHEGQFVKDTGSSRIDFKITRSMMDHWHKTFGEMSKDGLAVPVPVEHTKDPEKRRGTAVEFKRQPNKRGISALYARVRFNDVESAKLAKSGANVSIYVPKKATNGHGKDYVMPVEHIAITDYPVLHDLEPFQAVALSLTTEGEIDMTLRELANQAGIDPSITDEQQLIMALSQVLQQQKPAVPPARPVGPPARPAVPMQRPPTPMAASNVTPEPLTGTLLKMVRESRTLKLDGLSKGDAPKITPAARKKLEEKYLTDETLQYSHLDGYDDGFDTLVETLSLNEPIRGKGRTGPQGAVALSKGEANDNDKDVNPLLKDMDERAKSAREGGHRQYI